MAGLQSGEGGMIIDSVVWAQYINVTDRHTDSHVAIASTLRRVAKIHSTLNAKNVFSLIGVSATGGSVV